MSTISAGLVKTTNLTVNGLGAGAIDTENLNFQNLDVAGTLTVANEITAGNLKSNVKIAKDPFHLPTPQGPFAVDYLPLMVKNLNNTVDLFQGLSGKYWGTTEFDNDIEIALFVPSNRNTKPGQGVGNESIRPFDNSDASGRSVACGSFLYETDDAIMTYILNFRNSWRYHQAEPGTLDRLNNLNTLYNRIAGNGA